MSGFTLVSHLLFLYSLQQSYFALYFIGKVRHRTLKWLGQWPEFLNKKLRVETQGRMA